MDYCYSYTVMTLFHIYDISYQASRALKTRFSGGCGARGTVGMVQGYGG